MAGASGGFFNYRFAQPGRTMRQHIGRWYPERQFPFANQVITDPVTGQTDGVLKQCTLSDTCPKMFEINSETEYWNKAASLLTTDTQGNDLDLAATPNVRYYLLSSLSHARRGRNRDAANSCRTRCCPIRRSALSWSRSTSGSPTAPSRRPTGCPVAATARWCPRCRSRASASRRSPASPTTAAPPPVTCSTSAASSAQGILTTLPPAITDGRLPGLRAEDGRRRQRRRRHPAARDRRPGRDLLGMEHPVRRLRSRRPVQRQRPEDPVPGDEGRSRRHRRSTALGPGALPHPRRVRRQGDAGGDEVGGRTGCCSARTCCATSSQAILSPVGQSTDPAGSIAG